LKLCVSKDNYKLSTGLDTGYICRVYLCIVNVYLFDRLPIMQQINKCQLTKQSRSITPTSWTNWTNIYDDEHWNRQKRFVLITSCPQYFADRNRKWFWSKHPLPSVLAQTTGQVVWTCFEAMCKRNREKLQYEANNLTVQASCMLSHIRPIQYALYKKNEPHTGNPDGSPWSYRHANSGGKLKKALCP